MNLSRYLVQLKHTWRACWLELSRFHDTPAKQKLTFKIFFYMHLYNWQPFCPFIFKSLLQFVFWSYSVEFYLRNCMSLWELQVWLAFKRYCEYRINVGAGDKSVIWSTSNWIEKQKDWINHKSFLLYLKYNYRI